MQRLAWYARAVLITLHRAKATDAPRLLAIRRQAILQLAVPALSSEEAQAWQAGRDLACMVALVATRQVCIACADEHVVGWVASTDHCIIGLYVDPAFAGCGVGSQLLAAEEHAIGAYGYELVSLNASTNAEGFYQRRGYSASGERLSNGALPMRKHLRT